MEIINIKKNHNYLKEYIKLCSKEWGTAKTEEEWKTYINEKKKRILEEDKAISILGLIEKNKMIGFISLLKYDGEEKRELTPWYATMYVKKEYRKKGYSKILNQAIIEEAKKLGYNKIYLKTNLINYYEKFGAQYMELLKNGENLYYIDL